MELPGLKVEPFGVSIYKAPPKSLRDAYVGLDYEGAILAQAERMTMDA